MRESLKRMAQGVVLATLLTGTSALAEPQVYDVPELNGHPGYLTAYEISPDGIVDKVLILANGFDVENDSHPLEQIQTGGEYRAIVEELLPLGWDVVMFDYVRGDIDLKDNADNLADFIGVIDGVAAGSDYHLAVVGGSMGGIVVRTMFVQEHANMGVDTYVSVDSPHHGVFLSPWVDPTARFGFYVIQGDSQAAFQMTHGDWEFFNHYGWLEEVEHSAGFMADVIDPMNTLAIALSDGEGSWGLDWEDAVIHTKYHEVSSFVGTTNGELRSDYMPYHSVVMMDDTSTSMRPRFGYYKYWYNNTHTSYFDQKQANPRAEHGAPEHIVRQAVDFVLAHGPAE
ncbi:MAG: hypothetical protein ABFR97_11315 [Thermodesulfobacteriota bacterium]